MHRSKVHIGGLEFPFVRIHSLIIGSGAAGLNAAVQLFEQGIEDIAILTEKWGGGTSNNAGSDKQTYYRLAVDGPSGDSSLEMARDLQKGGCMHGDLALIEASLSLRAFNHLVASGVPFPSDEYGRYPGYQTDHDTKGRGTSAGPLTSRFMFEALAKKIVNYQIPILDRFQAIKLLYSEEDDQRKVIGSVALDLNKMGPADGSALALFQAQNVILATGGPGALYESSVYPENQKGSLGLALEIGARACNLTESQFGLASVSFRWNLSGSYQQVIPRYFSRDTEGREFEFLNQQFPNPAQLIRAIFLKGYQWPFDPRKLKCEASSLIDLLVFKERHQLNRKVFLDYRKNPIDRYGNEIDVFDYADDTIRNYLSNSTVSGKKPVERLAQMNQPAIDLYRRNGIRLDRDVLEIDVCAQHCNGGLRASIWWESNINNLFPVGEVNGTHGVYRPGGSALNSGQVGGFRIAQRIGAAGKGGRISMGDYLAVAESQFLPLMEMIKLWFANDSEYELDAEISELKRRMSSKGGLIRGLQEAKQALNEAQLQYQRFLSKAAFSKEDLSKAFYLRDHLISQLAFLQSIVSYLEKGGGSRGSFLVTDQEGAEKLPWDSSIRYKMDPGFGFTRDHILEVNWNGCDFETHWDSVRDIPEEMEWFETAWKKFREKKTKQ